MKNKSIIVIDTPDDCLECPLHYKMDLISMGNFTYKQCFGCRYIPEDIEDPCIPDIFSKPDWCPLSPIPEKIDLDKYFMRGDCKSMTHMVMNMRDRGWNECIDEILKGKE